ncbi:MAG: peptidoglycan DD-metalloendopeptidase family protein [Bacteroidales bacterium]|nr:peptidoglycan DD-metalloendopeptidase family protein [Bacteroidales bacterium]MBK9356113.1 peptidoglycan DD-metalloendopeptidase family protein [Bacteroidales bacterium]
MTKSGYGKLQMKRCLIVSVIAFFMILVVPRLYGQDKKSQLQQKKAKIEEEINYTNKLLNETKKNKQVSLNQLVLLNKQIGKRQELISAISGEIGTLDKMIEETNDTIIRLTQTIKQLKEEYARMIYFASKNRNAYSRLMFIFSARDFNQAYQRLKYFQQYSSYRKNQVRVIQENQALLNEKIGLLQKQKSYKLSLKKSEETEKQKLTREKNEQDRTIKNLSQKEKELLKKLRDSEKAARKLQKAIEDLIAAELRKATEAAKKSGTKPKPENKFGLTPAELQLSSSFAGNKGRLPWPTERGVISSTFGEHPHPVLKGIKTKNNGIDITTSNGESARAVFDGDVTSTMTLPNYNNVVIIRHGEFLTVYSNLDQLFVKKGDKVKIKQKIGNIQADDSGKTRLHFELWQGKNIQNPESWILKSR